MGGVSAEEILIGEDGTASVDFLPPTDPGTYRVLLNADGELSVLQFKVEQ